MEDDHTTTEVTSITKINDRESFHMQINCGLVHGFIVRESGNIVAGFSTAEEMGRWIAQELKPFDPAAKEEPPPIPIQVPKKRWGGR